MTLYLEKSASVKVLMESLAKAQLEFTPIAKDAEADVIRNGKRVKFRYATLDSLYKSTKPFLLKHGIVPRSDFVVNDEGVTLVTSLTKGDEYICSTLPIRMYEDDEKTASHMTKMTKAAYKNILSLASEEDAPPEVEQDSPHANAVPADKMWRQQLMLAKQAIDDAKTAATLDDILAKVKGKISSGDMDPHHLGQVEEAMKSRMATLRRDTAKVPPRAIQRQEVTA
jgi:hypothetical protein